MVSLIKKLLFKDKQIRTFMITRLLERQIEETVVLEKGKYRVEVTKNHGMICLDPFCVAVLLPTEKGALMGTGEAKILILKKDKLNASISVSFIETVAIENSALLLYRINGAQNHQLSILHRLVFFAVLIRSKKNTYNSRRVISALYSYPRAIIIVSYRDDGYYNMFPMDIQSYMEREGLYILGLRTTNVTLDKIIAAKKVVVCDTDSVDIATVYNLGKHSSASPTKIEDLPFATGNSGLFGFPVPAFAGSYKEVEIIHHRKMGYHMLLVGKVVNAEQLKPDPSSLYHVGFLQSQKGNYTSIDGLY